MEDFLSCDERDLPPFAGCLSHQALRAIVIVRSECVRQDADLVPECGWVVP